MSLAIFTKGSFAFIYALTAVVLLSSCSSDDQAGEQQAAPPPAQVTVVTLDEKSISLTTELPGRAVAVRKAEVRPQISGIIQKRLFEEGAEVKAGEQLYQIDPARYDAALQTAKANLARAQANQASIDAQFKRYQNLIKEKAISQQQFDETQATYHQAKADVEVAQAALKAAEIDLAYTRVRAPISGRIGISNITEGALVSAQQANILATIYQLDPIYIDVAQPSRSLLNIRRQAMAGNISAKPGTEVQLTLEDGSQYEHVGELQFSEMNVNESTGTVVVRAVVPNPDHLLLPGMFVRANIAEATKPNAVLVPQRGVTRNRQGDATALVVTEANTVEVRTIVASRAVGNQWLVQSGLEAGDRVIVEGLQKVQPGASVNPIEQTAAENAGSSAVTQTEG